MFYVNDEIGTTSKFDMIKFLNFDVDNIDCHGSYMLQYIPQLPLVGTKIITSEQYRPDILSYNLYGTTDYWWVLMWYNAITNIKDLKSGITINYPSKMSIENLYIDCCTAKKVN